MPSKWVEQLKERAAAAGTASGTNPPDRADDTEGGNSTIRFQNHRARQLGALGDGLTAEQWLEILEKFDYKCAYCGVRAPLEIDHIIPPPKGPHDVSNVVPACKSCNSAKKDKTLVEWLTEMVTKGKVPHGL